MTNYQEYFEYLSKRSLLGLIYRRFYLYPKLSSYLNGKILDVGCGIGDFIRYNANVIGVDINPECVHFCRSKGLNVRLMASGEIPFEFNSYDSVILDNVLEHLKDPEELLAEIKRVLRAGGNLLVGVPGKKGFRSDDDHKCFYDLDLLKDTLSQAGFSYQLSFYTPLKSRLLDNHASQYCLYGVFKNQ